MEDLAAIILSAGAGRRLGSRPKALLERDGQPLLVRMVDQLEQAGLRQIHAVLGHHAKDIEPVLALAQADPRRTAALRWVCNPSPDGGTAASLRAGLGAVESNASAVVVVLADLPLLNAQDIRDVLQAWRTRGPEVGLVLPVHDGTPGHPLILGTSPRRWLAEQPSTIGVREWRLAHPNQVQQVQVRHSRCTTDVDTEADLAALARDHGVTLRWPNPR